MDHKAYQPKMPDIMEAVFDAVYLLFDFVAGIVFFAMATSFPGSSGRSVEAPPRSSI